MIRWIRPFSTQLCQFIYIESRQCVRNKNFSSTRSRFETCQLTMFFCWNSSTYSTPQGIRPQSRELLGTSSNRSLHTYFIKFIIRILRTIFCNPSKILFSLSLLNFQPKENFRQAIMQFGRKKNNFSYRIFKCHAKVILHLLVKNVYAASKPLGGPQIADSNPFASRFCANNEFYTLLDTFVPTRDETLFDIL